MWRAMMVVLIAGCGGGSSTDDAGAIDAEVSTGPDAADLCDGDLTVEGQVFELDSGENLFEYEVSDGGGAATSAPNGRVVLCVGRADEVEVETTGDGAVGRVDNVSAAMVGRVRTTGEAYPFGMLSEASVAALAGELGVDAPAADSTWLVVHVLDGATGAALEGAEVAVSGVSDGFARQDDGTFVAGAMVAAGGAVLFPEVTVPGTPAVNVTPPEGFADCVGPDGPSLLAEGLSGIAFVCE
jgi:hypothetical protein